MHHIVQKLVWFFLYSSLGYYLSSVVLALRFRRERLRTPPPLPDKIPHVAILRPLHGFSAQMLDNVRNLLEVEYPKVTFVIGATGHDDGSAKIVQAIAEEYKGTDLVTTVGQYSTGNPKVGKLMWMLERAPEADVVMMIDADGRVDRDHVKRVVSELYAEDDIGLVTCVYCGIPARSSIGARLEALFINTDFAPMAIISKYFENMRHAYASCIAIKKNVLDSVGGLNSVKDAFGDDLLLGRKVAMAGFKIKASSAIVTMTTEEETIGDFWRHQLRGWRVDRRVRPISVGRILVNGPFWASIALLVSGLSMSSLTMLALVATGRIAMTAAMIRALFSLPLPLTDLLLVFFKDFLLVGIWGASLIGNTVEWGGKYRLLTADGRMQEVPSATPEEAAN